ncbi:glycosyltransferase [Bacillus manliponensis]|uniref:tetratricopeptide repeat-containing glycosyltransferase family 2 protein n=1 Tax=Bacillus manliponensis TaxID=574376 RepID=UPI00351385EB
MKPFITACLIVKNEEDMLRRCLESLQGGVDEIVIVDTGSTDKTKEIAKEFTDKVHDFEWTDDFAEARNYAASYATGEWIIAVDADECVDPENFKAALEEIKEHDGKYDTYAVEIINFVGESANSSIVNNMARVYRNDDTIHFEGAIHEQLMKKDGEQNLVLSSVKLYHYGYLKNVIEKHNKQERNMKIIKKELKSGKDKGFTHFNYGQELRRLGKTKEALDAFIIAFQHKGSVKPDWVGKCLYFIIESLVELKRYEDALTIINDAEELFANTPDFPFWRGETYLKQNRYEDAKEVFSHIINNEHEYNNVVLHIESKSLLPHVRLAEIYTYEKQDEKALQHYVEALNINGSFAKIIVNIIKLLNKYHSAQEVYGFLTEHQVIKTDYTRLEVLKDILNLGLGEVALLLTNDFVNIEHVSIRPIQLKANMIVGEEALTFATEDLMFGVQEKIFDVADLVVLYEMTKDSCVENVLKSTKFKHVLYSLFNETKKMKSMKQDEYLPILEKALRFNKPEFVERLIAYADIFPKQVYAKVADLFYENKYEDIALEFYQLADENHVTKQGYVNIIEYLLEVDNKEEACRISLEALKKFQNDFRFYKYGIELSSLQRKVITMEALSIFKDSEYLKQVVHTI